MMRMGEEDRHCYTLPRVIYYTASSIVSANEHAPIGHTPGFSFSGNRGKVSRILRERSDGGGVGESGPRLGKRLSWCA